MPLPCSMGVIYLHIFQILKQAGAVGEHRAMTSKELMHRAGLTRRELVRRVNREGSGTSFVLRPLATAVTIGRPAGQIFSIF